MPRTSLELSHLILFGPELPPHVVFYNCLGFSSIGFNRVGGVALTEHMNGLSDGQTDRQTDRLNCISPPAKKTTTTTQQPAKKQKTTTTHAQRKHKHHIKTLKQTTTKIQKNSVCWEYTKNAYTSVNISMLDIS